jgi:hypothetical protein
VKSHSIRGSVSSSVSLVAVENIGLLTLSGIELRALKPVVTLSGLLQGN